MLSCCGKSEILNNAFTVDVANFKSPLDINTLWQGNPRKAQNCECEQDYLADSRITFYGDVSGRYIRFFSCPNCPM